MINESTDSAAIDTKMHGVKIRIHCVERAVLVSMRSVCGAIGMYWSDLERSLLIGGNTWEITERKDVTPSDILMPARLLDAWLNCSSGAFLMSPSRRSTAISRESMRTIWAYEFPRQVLHIFPASSDAQSHSATFARKARQGAGEPDAYVKEGVRKAFLAIRQNRKPKAAVNASAPVLGSKENPTPARTPAPAARRGLTRTRHITPELVEQVHAVFRSTHSFQAVRKHFNLTQQALGRIISGDFKDPSPELEAAFRRTFGARASF